MISNAVDAKRLQTLIEINTLINSVYNNPKDLLTRILESATRLTNGEASSLLMVNFETNKLYFEIALGSAGSDVQKMSINMGEGIAGWVAQNNTSLIVNDVEEDRRYFGEISKKVGYRTSSILAVPMRLKDVCTGVIEILNKKDGGKFTQDDLEWLEIFANQAALAIQNANNYFNIKDQVNQLKKQIGSTQWHTFIGESEIIKKQLDIAYRAAQSDSTVLLLGESGVGKELFAEQIHLHSSRSEMPFIRVNCAAIPETLLESELFGHVKGAFTDAHQDRRGRFELADQGSIFLDEIGELPLTVQSKLLRVLQTGVFEPLGATEPITVNTRIITATNKDLEKAIQDGSFRKDLYYRLYVLPIEIPPLRKRKDDIMDLAQYFRDEYSKEVNKKITHFSPEAVEELISYHWPGNVRELQNVIERAVVITQNEYIGKEDLLLSEGSQDEIDKYRGKSLKDALNNFKKTFIISVLEEKGWNQTETASVLGIQRTYLSRLMKELNINKRTTN